MVMQHVDHITLLVGTSMILLFWNKLQTQTLCHYFDMKMTREGA